MLYIRCFAVLLALVLGLAAARPASAQGDVDPLRGEYDMRRSVNRGLTANPQIESARAALSSAERSETKALSDFGFTATASWRWDYEGGRTNSIDDFDFGDITNGGGEQNANDHNFNLSLDIRQPLFTGFRLLSSYQRAQLRVDDAESRLENAELQLSLSIQTTFLDLLTARQDVETQKDSVARLEEQLKVNQAFYDVGLRPRLDVLEAETDLATAQQELLSAQNRVRTTEARLNSLLNLPIRRGISYVGELGFQPFELTLDECLDRAADDRPDLAIAKKAVQIAMEDEDIIISDYYPQLFANFNLFTQGENVLATNNDDSTFDQDGWTFSTSLSWEFFDWGQTYFDWQAAKENTRSLIYDFEQTQLDAYFEVESNYLDMQEAAQRIDVARKSLVAAREAYRQAVARYQAQVGTNTDVLDAQERLTRAQGELTSALADYQTALANLYVSIGVKDPALM
jgi:outer membrane protein TolC